MCYSDINIQIKMPKKIDSSTLVFHHFFITISTKDTINAIEDSKAYEISDI